jgi:2-methylcitrate dehydratase PrpD
MLTELLLSTSPLSGDATLTRVAALHAGDALACLAAGAATDEGRALLEFYGFGSNGGEANPAGLAALVRMSEYDAIHVPSCLTPAIVVPVGIALAPDIGTFVRALEISVGVGLCLAEALGGVEALERGVWPTLFAAPAMAAVATGICQGLPPEELVHAVALALAGASGRLGRPSGAPSGRWLAIGEAVEKGMRAARAASMGFRGDPSLVSGDWLRAQGATVGRLVPRSAGSALAAIGFKPFVAARQGMNALAAFRELAAELDAASIERVVIELPPACLQVVTRPLARGERLSRVANLALRIGVAATSPDRLFDIDAMLCPDDHALAFAQRVEISADPLLDAGSHSSWPSRVSVRTGGRERRTICQRLECDAGDLVGGEAVLAEKIARLEAGDGPSGHLAAEIATAHAAMRQGRPDAITHMRSIVAGLVGEAGQDAGSAQMHRLVVNRP